MCMCAVMAFGVSSKNSPPVIVLSMIGLANSVSINGDKRLIGTYACDMDFPRPAYVYVRSNGVWSEQAEAKRQ